jgi:hypothetical protein
MTRNEDMASPAAPQSHKTEERQKHGQNQHDNCIVDEKSTFTGYASSGGSTVHRVTFSPRILGPKDVEIDIWYSGICDSDLHILEEDWGKLSGEVVAGHQIAGTIAAAGPEALYKVGERVGASLVVSIVFVFLFVNVGHSMCVVCDVMSRRGHC